MNRNKPFFLPIEAYSCRIVPYFFSSGGLQYTLISLTTVSSLLPLSLVGSCLFNCLFACPTKNTGVLGSNDRGGLGVLSIARFLARRHLLNIYIRNIHDNTNKTASTTATIIIVVFLSSDDFF